MAGQVPADVLSAYGWQDAAVEPMSGGLINATFLVRDGERRAVLQRLHPVFGADVNLDLDAITSHIAGKGMLTPRLIPTRTGEAWIADGDGKVWRATTFVDGESFARVPSTDHARSAGALVGRFHVAVADFTRPFSFTRAGVHDTAGHLGRLTRAAAAPPTAGEPAELQPARVLAAQLIEHAAALDSLAGPAPRVGHGDLKISNVLFARGTSQALCLVDLDTLGMLLLAHELGDALRSWCNPAGEDVEQASHDRAIFAAALTGFGAVAGRLVSEAERRTIVAGWETVTLEVGIRFCADVFEDRYFGWDAARYPSRRAHNLVRARGQASLARSIRAARADLDAIARTSFA